MNRSSVGASVGVVEVERDLGGRLGACDGFEIDGQGGFGGLFGAVAERPAAQQPGEAGADPAP